MFMASNFPFRRQAPADMVDYPHLVKDGNVERMSVSIGPRSVAQIGHGCSLVIHPHPFDADGTLSEPCAAFLLSSVATVARHFDSPIRIVWSAASSTYVEADGTISSTEGALIH
jgi:hypothetical protein